MTFSVPDLLSARSRFEKLGVTIEDLQIPHTQLIVLRDPDNYPIQIMSQDFDLHAELHDVCRNVVVEGTEKSLEDIMRSQNPETLAEAGLTTGGNNLSVPHAKAPCRRRAEPLVAQEKRVYILSIGKRSESKL